MFLVLFLLYHNLRFKAELTINKIPANNTNKKSVKYITLSLLRYLYNKNKHYFIT